MTSFCAVLYIMSEGKGTPTVAYGSERRGIFFFGPALNLTPPELLNSYSPGLKQMFMFIGGNKKTVGMQQCVLSRKPREKLVPSCRKGKITPAIYKPASIYDAHLMQCCLGLLRT